MNAPGKQLPASTTNGEQHRGGSGAGARAVAILALGAILAWLIVTRSFAAYFADVDPAWALALDPRQPDALLNLADRALNGPIEATGRGADSTGRDLPGERITGLAKSAEKVAGTVSIPRGAGEQGSSDGPREGRAQILVQARQWAQRALVQQPLSARAYRILGQVAAEEGEPEKAAGLMQAAVQRSLHESAAVYWLLQRSFARNDVAAVVRYGDLLMRTRADLAENVVPFLGHIAETSDGLEAVKALLASNPPYRARLLHWLPNGVSDARTPLELLQFLQSAGHAPQPAELRSYLDFLVSHTYFELAYYAWLQFLPPDDLGSIGLLFNRGFERPPSGLPFDWRYASGSGVSVAIASLPDRSGEHALRLEFSGGRAEFSGVSQLVILAPGQYTLEGSLKGELIGRRGLTWRVQCVDALLPLAEGPMFTGVKRAWVPFKFAFSVPATNCPAQRVHLALDARSASEKLVSGTVWYDDLQITRTGE